MKQITSVTILTTDVARLRSFYQAVFQITPFDEGDVHTSFLLSERDLGLNIYSARAMESDAPGSMQGAGSGNFVLEVETDDPDADYTRLLSLGAVIVVPPTTFPWGRRAVWFRDPDGNLISFSRRVS